MVDIKIDEIVEYVNEKMKNGLSMAQIEKEMKVGKDTLRKKLNRNNFKYDKNLKKYIYFTSETHSNTSKKEIEKKLIENNNIDITRSITKKETKKNSNSIKNNVPEGHLFTEEEITILKNIIKNYKLCTTDIVLDGEIVTRSVRTYKNVLDRFVQYCKDNKLSQKDSIAIALIDFMKR
ncbi:hypothetical protein H8S20_16880 [Clostridium sp. NSJ-6]|uniref:DNA-binding protein n=1 Tax=Clostridium hominis TaxID=2763036 RepID=A0ABR7DIM7_9CLOT|nr:hypothetical protein [Clostridium hominis]MBC5630533.1 hypothetical protein [Clostridium hominis]